MYQRINPSGTRRLLYALNSELPSLRPFLVSVGNEKHLLQLLAIFVQRRLVKRQDLVGDVNLIPERPKGLPLTSEILVHPRSKGDLRQVLTRRCKHFYVRIVPIYKGQVEG